MVREDIPIALPSGIACEDVYEVREGHVAKGVGTGVVEVLATPYMIMFMEVTAFKCIERFLPEGFTAVGTGVNVRHRNPAPQGTRVRVRAELLEQRGRVLIFRVVALLGNIVIGDGTHDKYIIEKNRFEEKALKILENVKSY
jgi:fluoroacetyl-CoA thioesterase